MWKPFHCIFRAEPFCKTFDVVLFWSIFGSLHSYSRFPKAWQMPLGKRAFFEEFAVPKSKMHFHLRPSNDFPLGQNYLKIPLSHASQCWKIKQKISFYNFASEASDIIFFAGFQVKTRKGSLCLFLNRFYLPRKIEKFCRQKSKLEFTVLSCQNSNAKLFCRISNTVYMNIANRIVTGLT